LSLNFGALQWKFKTQNAVYSTPEVAGDLAILASTDGNIYGLHAATGKQVWRFETQRPIVASPRVADGIVYIGSSEGKFRALEANTGKLLWQFERLGGFVETKPLVHDGKVIFGAWDQHLYALDAKTGKLAWKWRGDRSGTLFSPAACWPVAAKGKVFIVAPDRRMTAIDAKTGRQIWRTGNYMVRESIGISEDQTRFYIRAMQDSFYALSTLSRQPETIWEQKTDFGYDINSAMLVEKTGVLFYGTKNGLVYALNAKTGAVKWEHKVGVGVVNTVVPLSPSRVLTSDFDGRVTLLDTKE
jgi:outer membrane protein assembly factor BamB